MPSTNLGDGMYQLIASCTAIWCVCMLVFVYVDACVCLCVCIYVFGCVCALESVFEFLTPYVVHVCFCVCRCMYEYVYVYVCVYCVTLKAYFM